MVSILIPVFNQLQYTQRCLESIFENVSQIKTPYEVLIYDNGSTDGTTQYLQGLESASKVKVIYNKENKGFPFAMNRLAEIAKGNYLWLCNNDIIITSNTLEKLLRCIKSDSQIVAVGPWTNHSSGYQKVNPQPTYKGDEELHKYAEKFNGEEKYVNFLVFFCCLIKRSVWDELGGLNEAYGIGTFEDNEFCWKVIEKGYKLKVCNAYIHHYTSKSFGCHDDAKKMKEYATLMARNQKIFLHKINRYETISLCMIVSDKEKPEILKRCLDSVAQWVDEICIVFNYQWWSNSWRLRKLIKICEQFTHYGQSNDAKSLLHNPHYLKWTNFGDMRNKSLEMASCQWCLWMDCDDVLLHPAGMRDLILQNPAIDAFRFKLLSKTELGTQEMIYHSNLFRNKPEFRFSGRVHEDINLALNKAKAKYVTTDITIQHLGYLNLKTWKQKNLRNYKLLLLDLKDTPSTLVYYHIVNCLLIIGGYKNMIKATHYVDECLEKFPMKQEDPLLAKMWMLRGVACMDAGQISAAKQSLHKAWGEYKSLDAAVNLAKLYMDEKNWDKVIEILTPIYEMKDFTVDNISIDTIQLECLMLEKLGFAYHHKAEETKDKEKIVEWIKKAETHYREYLSIRPNLMVIDRLCKVLRQTNRAQEAAFWTNQAVNQFPGYFTGWFNIAQFELQNKHYNSARLYLQESLRLKPDYKEARHNLAMLRKGRYIK